MRLSIVVPVFNEEGNLRPLCERMVRVARSCADDFEIIFVNDGSDDGSLSIMRDLSREDPHVKYVSFSRNFGHEMASTAGLDRASGDAVVLIDGDLQDPPEVIADMVAAWKRGADVVYARRRRRAGESVVKRLSAYLFYRLIRKLSEVDIPVDSGDFRLMDRRVVEALKRCRENPRFVRGLVSWVGFRQEAVLYDRAKRHAGETKYDLVKLIRLSWEAVCAFSLMPLRMTVWLGVAVTLVSVFFTLRVGIQRIFFSLPIEGYALQTCGLFFLGGVQLVVLGVLAQYVGHIFKHTQNRPLYIIDDEGGWRRSAERTPAETEASRHGGELPDAGRSQARGQDELLTILS